MAFEAETAWIENESLRKHSSLAFLYSNRDMQMFSACALVRDVKIMEIENLAEIERRGFNLSGG